ncbi:MAG: DUF3179 domain-containing protein [Calditrichaeota bacterium]|nr:DUF3179 domain-containing protein [Calditrichota bacterium]
MPKSQFQKAVRLLLIFLLALSTTLFAQIEVNNVNQEWKTNKDKRNVELDEFRALLKRDGIPPIYEPKFWTQKEAGETFFAHEPVIAVEINGQAKAYPLSILMFHEIVNDELEGTPYIATFCPLCNASIVFDRRLSFEGKDYLFDIGVSGMLRNSDMVMWDHQTETWWQQFTGEGLVGDLAGAQLSMVVSQVISVEDFFKNYPDGKILSTENGMDGGYGHNPYVNYDDLSNEKPRLFFGDVDKRLPAMERIINIKFNDIHRIYPLSEITKKDVINDNAHGKQIVIFYQQGTVSVLDKRDIKASKDIGAVTVFDPRINGRILYFNKVDNGFEDEQTKSLWSITGKCFEGELKGKQLKKVHHGNHFAFAWFAFQPESEIYGQD